MLNRLQVLRGGAALAVLISHFGHWNELASAGAGDARLVAVGPYAVYVFFVISGYIICHAHKDDMGERRGLLKYFLKRAFRIYPAYWLFGAASLGLAAAGFATWDHTAPMARSLRESWAALTLLPLNPSNQYCSLLGVGWSLFYEVVFYLLFAAYFLSFRFGCFVLLLYSLTCVSSGLLGFDVFWLSKTSVLFAVGCGIAIATDRWKLRIRLGRLLVLTGVASYAASVLISTTQPALGRLGAFIAAVLLVVGVVGMDLHAPLPTNGFVVRSSVWIGVISYSLYLCHTAVASVLYRYIGPPSGSVLVAIGYVLAPILVASASYLAIERTCQRLGKWLVDCMARSV